MFNQKKQIQIRSKKDQKTKQQATKIKIDLSENLKNRGLSTGKITLGSKGGRHNMLNVYMIFDKKINIRHFFNFFKFYELHFI